MLTPGSRLFLRRNHADRLAFTISISIRGIDLRKKKRVSWESVQWCISCSNKESCISGFTSCRWPPSFSLLLSLSHFYLPLSQHIICTPFDHNNNSTVGLPSASPTISNFSFPKNCASRFSFQKVKKAHATTELVAISLSLAVIGSSRKDNSKIAHTDLCKKAWNDNWRAREGSRQNQIFPPFFSFFYFKIPLPIGQEEEKWSWTNQ